MSCTTLLSCLDICFLCGQCHCRFPLSCMHTNISLSKFIFTRGINFTCFFAFLRHSICLKNMQSMMVLQVIIRLHLLRIILDVIYIDLKRKKGQWKPLWVPWYSKLCQGKKDGFLFFRTCNMCDHNHKKKYLNRPSDWIHFSVTFCCHDIDIIILSITKVRKLALILGLWDLNANFQYMG